MSAPLRKFTKKIKGSSRTFGVFLCADCDKEYVRRMDQKKRSQDRCKPCADKDAGIRRRTHGHNNSNSRLHVTWSNMKRRCINPTPREQRNYSHVSLCQEWMDFEPFMHWALENGYDENKTIDRKEQRKGYSPENCRFVDLSTQSANRRKYRPTKSGYLGVSWQDGVWRAKVQWRGDQIHLGSHGTAREAALARDGYIIKNGWPHTLNFPDRMT